MSVGAFFNALDDARDAEAGARRVMQRLPAERRALLVEETARGALRVSTYRGGRSYVATGATLAAALEALAAVLPKGECDGE